MGDLSALEGGPLPSLFDLLRLFDLYPNKSLGQVFLKDDRVVDAIIRILAPGPSDTLLEIGAGPGLVTQRLAGLVGRLVAIEIDEKFTDLHQMLFADLERPPLVLYQDARKIHYRDLVGPESGRLLVFGNLPYYLTTDLIFKALADLPDMSFALFMVEADVRHRLTASPGSKAYGSLSAASQLFGSWKLERPVTRAAFYPRPRVDSVLVSLTPGEDPGNRRIGADRSFHRFLTGLFQYRRKHLANALKGSAAWPTDGTGEDRLASFMSDQGLSTGVRAEELTPSQLARLFLLMA